MKRKGIKTLTTFFGVLLSCAIVFSFGLHTVELAHIHPGDHTHHQGESASSIVGDYMHGTEKKNFLFVLASLLFSALYIRSSRNPIVVVLMVREIAASVRALVHHVVSYCYLSLLFAKGILHTKCY